MTDTLTGMNVAVLVTDGFEQVEMTGPVRALKQADVTVKIIGERSDEVRGYNHQQEADSFKVDLRFEDADPLEFDAVLLPGGRKNGEHIRTIPAAQHFVQQIDEMGKPVAAICHGTLLLAETWLIEGRTLTSWPGIADAMREAGANWVDQEVVVDGNLITSRKPDDVPAFSQHLIDALRQRLQASIVGTRDEHPEIGPQG
jgi:protease I